MNNLLSYWCTANSRLLSYSAVRARSHHCRVDKNSVEWVICPAILPSLNRTQVMMILSVISYPVGNMLKSWSHTFADIKFGEKWTHSYISGITSPWVQKHQIRKKVVSGYQYVWAIYINSQTSHVPDTFTNMPWHTLASIFHQHYDYIMVLLNF